MGILSVTTRPSTDNNQPEAWFQHGKSAILSGAGLEAERDFTHILEVEPEHPEALQGLLTAWLLQQKSDQVIEYYTDSPHSVQVQLREFMWIALSMQVGHISSEGYAEWLQLPSNNPGRLQGLRTLSQHKTMKKCGVITMDWANAALESYNLEEAAQAIRQTRNAQPRLPEREIARLYARYEAIVLKEHPEIAALIAESAQIVDPVERFERLESTARRNLGFSALQRAAGLALFEAQRPVEAMRYLNRAVDANPYWLNAWVELSMAALQAGRLIRAKEALTRAEHLSQIPWICEQNENLRIQIEQRPNYAQIEWANDRLEVGDYPSAILHLQEALRSDPDASILRWKLGESYLSLKQHKQAASYLRSAWADALETQQKLTFEQLAILELAVHQYIVELLLKGNLEDAIDLLEEMLATSTHFELLQEDLSIAEKLNAGQIHFKSFQWYEKARQKLRTQPDDCINWLNKAIEYSPHFSEALLARAILYSARGKLLQAEQDIQAAMSTIHTESMGLFHMAGLTFLQQNTEMACALWERCLTQGVYPWAQRSAANLHAFQQTQSTHLYLAWLPTHRRVINFTPELKSNAEKVKTSEDSLFSISSSAELAAPNRTDLSPDNIRFLTEQEVPRFSDLAPSASTLPAPSDPLAFNLSDTAGEHPLIDDVPVVQGSQTELFGSSHEDTTASFLDGTVTSFLDEHENTSSNEGWSLSKEAMQGTESLLFEPKEPTQPLFEITPDVELQAEFPMDIVREKAVEDVLTLSQLTDAPTDNTDEQGTTQEPQPDASNVAPLAPIAFLEPLPQTSPEPHERTTPRSDEPQAELQTSAPELEFPPEPPPETASSSSLASTLFGADDDLSSFLDEAFLSLDNIEKKEG